MTGRLGRGLAAALPVLLPAVAAAQARPADGGSGRDVVVTARRAAPAQAIRQLARTVTAMTNGQVARFGDRVCPAVAGLPEPHGKAVAARIGDNARAVGLAVGKPGCVPNVTVIFVGDGRAAVAGLPRRIVPDAERRRLLADHGPVHVFAATQLRSRDGDRVGTAVNGLSAGSGETRFLLVRDASIINAPVRQDLIGAVVLIDRTAAQGHTLRQLADYATVRALARTSPVASAAEPTILTLFAGRGTGPAALTPFDAAYLKALYTGQATAGGLSKVSAMGRSIARDRAAAGR